MRETFLFSVSDNCGYVQNTEKRPEKLLFLVNIKILIL